MTLRRWSLWLATMALLVCASWACWRIGLAADAVREGAQATTTAMQQTAEYKAATWEIGPPPK